MSFIVSFQGQFKPYNIALPSNPWEIQNIAPLPPLIPHPFPSSEWETENKNARDLASSIYPGHSRSANESKIESYKQHTEERVRETIHHLHPWPVREIMTKNVHILRPDNKLADAWELMNKHRFHHVPILDEDLIVGILSDRDLLRRKGNAHLIKEIMTQSVKMAREETRVVDVARFLVKEKINCLPIVNSRNKISGIITHTDILKFLMAQMPLEQYI